MSAVKTKTQPRIALLIHSLSGGGAERLMAQLASRWAEQAAEVHLVTWSHVETDAYPLHRNVVRHGLDLLRPSKTPFHGLLANLRRVKRLSKCISEIAPDLVLSFSDQMNIVALEATRNMEMPVWISEHSNPEQQRLSRFWEAWRRRSYPRCSGCVALTDSIASYMHRWITAGKFVVIPPAISVPPNSGNSSLLDGGKPGDSGGQKRIVAVGRLSEEKDQVLLLDAWSLVADELPTWSLRIVGDGPEFECLARRASSLPRVELVGWQDDVWAEYRSADLFALPSRYEGFPVAMLEAMSQRVCCISTESTAAIEQLQANGDCLRVVPTGDVRQLAEAIVDLASDRDLRESLAEAGQRASERFHWEQIGPLWDAVLQRAVSLPQAKSG